MKKTAVGCLAALVAMFCLDVAAGLVREAKFPAEGEIARPAVGATLVLPSFDGAAVAVELASRSVSTSGIVTYGGRTPGSWLNNATLTVVKGGFVATVTDNATSHVFTFRGQGGSWVVREVAPSRKGRCGTPGHSHRKRAAVGDGKAALVRAAPLTGDPLVDGAVIMQRGELVTNVVDILVGVDKSAAAWIREKSMFADTENAVESFAAWAVMRCNCTYANTGLDQFFTFRLVGVVEIDVDCSLLRDDECYVDSEKILDDLTEGKGASNYKTAYKKVRDMRETVCADIVSFLVSCGSDTVEGLVGVGCMLDNDTIRSKEFPEVAYNVCLVESVAEDSTMAHEIGHNMGAGHAKMKDGSNSGPQLYDYSSGYYFCVTNDDISMHGGTAMAYDSDGYEDDYGPGERWGQAPENAVGPELWNAGCHVIVPYFSSPNHTYKYELEGQQIDSGVALGDEKHDNTRLLSLTYPLAANYRVSKCSLSLVAPAGGDKTLAGSGVYAKGATVTMKATPAAGRVFAGWYMAYDEESGVFSDPLASPDGTDFRSPTAKIALPGGTDSQVVVYARFATADEDGAVKADIPDEETSESGELALALGPRVESLSLPKLALTGLPSGLKYNATTLTIAGTATKPGVYAVTVKTTNSTVKKAVESTFMLTVPNFSCAALPNLRKETGYYNFEAGLAFVPDSVDCSAADADWKVSASGLPAGLKFDANAGAITGVATKPGVYTVTFTATKGREKQVATITMNIAALPDNAVGTFNGFVKAADGEENLGTFQLTATDAGKLTAKVTTAAGSYSFSGTCWDAVEGGVYSVAFATKSGERMALALDSMMGWDKNQLTGTFAAVSSKPPYQVEARKNAFGKMWYFNAAGNEADGWALSFAGDAKAAALTVTLNADGSTKIAGKLGSLAANASGYADVTSLSKGVIIADFAPVVSIKDGKTTLKRALSVRANLWFDRSNEHQGGAGSAKLVDR